MKISAISNTVNCLKPKNNNIKSYNNEKNISSSVSFKGVYLEDMVLLGAEAEPTCPPNFLPKDAVLINEIARLYPYQDCFIRANDNYSVYLEYREKPHEVQHFNEGKTGKYIVSFDPEDRRYPPVQLLLNKKSPLTYIIGRPNDLSYNPSLSYTIKCGFEVHKKLLEKKYEIMDVVGQNSPVNLGEETLDEKAHKEISDIEIAVLRHLVESAHAALTDKYTAKRIYDYNYPRVQSRLKAQRRADFTTSIVTQEEIKQARNKAKDKTDICEESIKRYPDPNQNMDRINYLVADLKAKGLRF